MGLRAPRRRQLALLGGGASMIIFALAASAAAIPVRGSISNADELGEAPGSTGYWSERNGFIPTKDDNRDPARELAVVLVGEGEGTPPGCDYAFSGGDLMPRTIVSKVGVQLRIENQDGCAHELYAEGHDSFSAISTAPGNARTLDLGAGDWPLADRLYAHVEGHLHVIPDLVACATVDARGGYAFEDVTPGTYTVRVYRGDAVVGESEIEVPETGTLTVDPITMSAGAPAGGDDSDDSDDSSEDASE